MPQVKYTADGLPYYDATDQQTQPYFPQVSGPMLPAPGNPAQPSEGWNQGVRDTLHGMTIGPVQDAAKALQGGMTPNEAQDFAFGAALGLLPMGRGLKPVQKGIRAYHGSPHDFDRFDMSKIGTGEGAQAYGHGLYFAENEGVARAYRDQLSKFTANKKPLSDDLSIALGAYGGDVGALLNFRKDQLDRWVKSGVTDTKNIIPQLQRDIRDLERLQKKSIEPSGKMYEVNINAHPDQFLDWDKPLSKQPGVIQNLGYHNNPRDFAAEAAARPGTPEYLALERAMDTRVGSPGVPDVKGADLYRSDVLRQSAGDERAMSDYLRERGIPGIKYLDQGSRTAGEGSRNYVVFDDKLIDIIKKYGWAAVAPMLGLTAENLPIPKAQAPQFQ
jgi:hypothetical protein